MKDTVPYRWMNSERKTHGYPMSSPSHAVNCPCVDVMSSESTFFFMVKNSGELSITVHEDVCGVV